MLKIQVDKKTSEFDRSTRKVYVCSECGTSHTYYYSIPKVCEKQSCSSPIPDVTMLQDNEHSKILWHFYKCEC